MNWPATGGIALLAFVVGFVYGANKMDADTAPDRARAALALQRKSAALVASERVLSEMIARDARWTEGEMIEGWPMLELGDRTETSSGLASTWDVGPSCVLVLFGPPDDLTAARVVAGAMRRDTGAAACVSGLLGQVAPSLVPQIGALANRLPSEGRITLDADGANVSMVWIASEASWSVTATRLR